MPCLRRLVRQGAPCQALVRLLRPDEHLGVRLVVDEADLGHAVEDLGRDVVLAAALTRLLLEPGLGCAEPCSPVAGRWPAPPTLRRRREPPPRRRREGAPSRVAPPPRPNPSPSGASTTGDPDDRNRSRHRSGPNARRHGTRPPLQTSPCCRVGSRSCSLDDHSRARTARRGQARTTEARTGLRRPRTPTPRTLRPKPCPTHRRLAPRRHPRPQPGRPRREPDGPVRSPVRRDP